jgi:membrane-bound inhibitor of C-type lysozyme
MRYPARQCALPRREYLCAGDARIVILVESKAARLTLNGHIYNMKQVETALGTKYAEGSVVWSSTGSDSHDADDLAAVLGEERIPIGDVKLRYRLR